MSTTDYTVPCHKSSVHPDGVCRKKLHKNIGSGFHRLVDRMDTEEQEAQLEQQKQQIEDQKKQLDLQFKLAQVGAGTHRVIKENRKKKG
jgi:hypothetical protein